MKLRTVNIIDHRISRLQALMKLLRAERRLAVLREKHHKIKFADPRSGAKKKCQNLQKKT